MKTGIELIAEEREKQIKVLDFTPDKDKKFEHSELLFLARYCMFSNEVYTPKSGWSVDYIKQFHLKPITEQLAIAGALIAAEIDRLQSMEEVLPKTRCPNVS